MDAVHDREAASPESLDEAVLRRFLNLYWLRPESGLQAAFKSQVFRDVEFRGPSLDISCGNGLFMFLHLGGVLDEDFDYYRSTRASEFSHDKEFVDIFDSSGEAYDVPIVQGASTAIEVGTDWKPNLLERAAKLGLYERLLEHDNNVVPLPLPEGHFKTVYSNSVHWIADPLPLMADVKRMLEPGGTAVLEVLTPYMLETLDRIEPVLGRDATRILDRSRRETMLGLRKPDAWTAVFRDAGLIVDDVRSIYPSSVLIDIWNIGTRPIAPLLIQMSDALTSENRSRIKREWVNIFMDLFRPLLSLPQTYDISKAPGLVYVLRKPA